MKDTLKAIDLKGKYLAMWTDKIESTNKTIIQFSKEDEDLL
jgi:hypothetical protein